MAVESNRHLWQIIAGTTVIRPSVLVLDELERNKSKLLKGLSEYTKPTTPSGEKLSKLSVKGLQAECVKTLSQFLSLDEEIAYGIYCSFLAYEYRGSKAELKNVLNTERLIHSFVLKVRDYYYSERLYILRCLKHLLNFWEEPHHPYVYAYAEIVAPLFKDGSTFVRDMMKQYKDLCEANAPTWEVNGSLMNTQQAAIWLHQNLKEQFEILQILLLYYKEFQHPTEELLELAKMFKSQGFGRRQTNKHLLDEVMEPLLNRIGFIQVLILIEGLDLEEMQDRNEIKDASDHHIVKSKSFKALDTLLSNFGDLPHHGPLILAWATYKQNISEDDFIQVKKLGSKAIHLKVFQYLRANLMSEPFNGKSMVALTSQSIIYGLMYSVFGVFHEDTLGNLEDIYSVMEVLLKNPMLAEDFFNRVEDSNGIGNLLHSASSVFPLKSTPLLTLSNALGSAGKTTALQMIAHLHNLNTYTATLDHSAQVQSTPEAGIWQLNADCNMYPSSSEALILPAGTYGQIIQNTNTSVMQWHYSYSGWDVFVGEVNLLLRQVLHSAGDVCEANVVRVTQIFALLNGLLKIDVKMVQKAIPQIESITQVVYQLLHRFSATSYPPLELLAACIEYLSLLIPVQTLEVWHNFEHTGLLPFLTENFDEVAKASSGAGLNTGLFGSLLAGQECTRGHYPVTLALLQLLNTAVQPLHQHKCSGKLKASILFITREIFPMFHKWRYYEAGVREKIVSKCLEVFHRVLNLNDEETSPTVKGVGVRALTVYSLLFTESGHTLLEIISTGVDTVEAVLSTQSSLNEGAGVDLIQLIRTAFSVLNRLLLLRSPADSSSPVENCLSTQPANNLARRHVVAIIAQYMYHYHDPRLPRLATVLLKRLAMIFPMSILACLGNDSQAICDIFLSRLAAATEDINLKVAIMEFLSICVETQPGLTEIFLNIKLNSTTLELSDATAKNGISMGKSSCLQTVLDLIGEKKQGTYECPPELLCAVLDFLNSLWYGRRETAMAVLRQKDGFWQSVSLSLKLDVEQNGGEDSEQQTIVETNTVAYIFKILSHELYYVQREKIDTSLQKVLEELVSNGRIEYWSKFLLTSLKHATKSMNVVTDPTSENCSIHMLRAWQSFLTILSSYKNKKLEFTADMKMSILKDLLGGLECQLSANEMNALNIKLASTASAFCLTLVKQWVGSFKKSLDVVEQLCKISSLMSQEAVIPSIQIGILCSLTLILQDFGASSNVISNALLRNLLDATCGTLQQNTRHLKPLHKAADQKTRDQVDLMLKLQIVCLSLVEEVLLQIKDPQIWLPILKDHATISDLLTSLDEWLNAQQGCHYVYSLTLLLTTLAKHQPSAEILHANGLTSIICLSQTHISDADFMMNMKPELNGESITWFGVYRLFLSLVSSLLNTLRYGFLEDAFNFHGVHQERMVQCMNSTGVMLSVPLLEESAETCRFLYYVAHYRREWRLHLPEVLNSHMRSLCLLTQRCVSLLIRPRLLEYILEKKAIKDEASLHQKSELLMTPIARRLSQQGSFDESDVSSGKVLQVQNLLLEIVSWSLAAQQQFSPDICYSLTDQSFDMTEFDPLLAIGFGTPSVEQDSQPTFGTLISCANMCIHMLAKIDKGISPERRKLCEGVPQTKSSVVMYVLENALMLIMSQAVLYLKAPGLASRDKQLLKRELSAELNSILVSLQRHFRRGATSPAPSPQTANKPGFHNVSTSSLSPATDPPFFKVVSMFVAQGLR